MREIFLQGFVLYAVISLLLDSYRMGVKLSVQNGLTSLGWFIFAFIIRMTVICMFSLALGWIVSTVASLIL